MSLFNEKLNGKRRVYKDELNENVAGRSCKQEQSTLILTKICLEKTESQLPNGKEMNPRLVPNSQMRRNTHMTRYHKIIR